MGDVAQHAQLLCAFDVEPADTGIERLNQFIVAFADARKHNLIGAGPSQHGAAHLADADHIEACAQFAQQPEDGQVAVGLDGVIDAASGKRGGQPLVICRDLVLIVNVARRADLGGDLVQYSVRHGHALYQEWQEAVWQNRMQWRRCPIGDSRVLHLYFCFVDIARDGEQLKPMDTSYYQPFVEHLQLLPLFKGLDVAILTQLAHSATWQEYAAGAMVFLEGDRSSGLYYLASGWLKVIKSSLDGREQVLRFIGPGELFNEVGAFANRPNPATAIALEAAGVWFLQRDVLMRLICEQPVLAQRIIENMADNMIHLVNLVADISLRSVTARLARLLLDEANNEHILQRRQWQTQSELAARLGTVPDVLQRALRTLVNEGAIQVQRREIRILNHAELKKWVV